ncbi:twin-arginine translocation signal domain-containing protein [Candidatus Bipolaricaulota bacterium]|nr:twin-arginine translocation signal domain-containing protein [Candidatus Bipolaricaulota bacterium]
MSKDKKISRRDFIKGAAITGAAVSVPGLWSFSSIGQSSKNVVKVGVRPPKQINPGTLGDSPGQVMASVYSDYLFRLRGEESERTRSLVEDYSFNEDRSEWSFKLREGVKFHHGTELTSRDLKYTVRRIMDPDVGSPAKTLFTNVEEVEEVDRYTTKFYLADTDPDFGLNFYDYNTSIVAHDFDYEKYGEQRPSGTGAFKIKDYKPGERMVLEKNPDYFLSDVPYVDELHFVILPEEATRRLRLQSGDLDILTNVELNTFNQLVNKNNIDGDYAIGGAFAPITMRTDRPPFNDNNVRLAMKYATDRRFLLDSVLSGFGDLGHDTPIAPTYEWYTDLGLREQNIEKARSLLAQAGHGSGLDVKLYYPSNVFPCPDTALNVKQLVEPAGINLKLEGSTSDVYYSKYWTQTNLKVAQWIHRENVLGVVKQGFRTGAAFNAGHYSNSELDEEIEKASTTVEPEARQKHFTKIQKILREEGPSVIPFHQGIYGATRKNIKDYKEVRNGTHELRFVKKT